jgi:hypothetical protein
MFGTIKRTSGHKTRKDTPMKLYKTTALPCMIYGSETWTLSRTDERRLGASVRYVAGYTLWDEGRSGEIWSQLRMGKMYKQIHGRKKKWLEHLRRMPSETAPRDIINGQEDVIQEGHEDDGLMFGDGMGYQAQPLQMMM